MLRCLPSVIAALILLSSTAAAHTPSVGVSPAQGAENYALVLVDAKSTNDLASARELITAEGGSVAVVVPPRAILGWLSPEAAQRVVGRSGILAVHHSRVDPATVGATDQQTRAAVSFFNDVASGNRARRREREAATARSADRPSMIDCSQPRPPIDPADFLRNLQMMGASRSVEGMRSSIVPQYAGLSDVMDGTVAVGVFLVESNGAIDPDLHTWSQSDQSNAISQVIEGLNWWVEQSRAFQLARPLQFTVVPFLATNPVCQQPYEPILHTGTDAPLWINAIMDKLGAIAGDSFVRVASFNHKLRDDNNANWAFSMFISYNPAPERTSFQDGRASWAYLGGPHTVILYRSYGWPLHQIISHETGHIFFACDEYSQAGYQTCSCSCAPEVRPQALNGNCEDASCTLTATACMMKVNEPALCPFTVAQIGWVSAVPKPVPTAPASLVATAPSPTQVNLLWQDTATSEDGFQIERLGGTGGEFQQLAVVAANTTTYTDFTVLPNTAYAYRVRAFNTTGTSDYSSPVSVLTPLNPSELSITTADLPSATVAVSYSHTMSAAGGDPPYSWVLESGLLPSGLSLLQAGTISGAPENAGTDNFVARVTDASGRIATKAMSLVVKPSAPLTITTSALPRGSVGNTYSQSLGASGGQTPYTWSLISGNLPHGLGLNQEGLITGTPERAGTSSFGIHLIDASGASVNATLSISVNPAIGEVTVETVVLPDASVGETYEAQLRAIGGAGPYRWSLKSGRLPDGLSLAESGLMSGQPTTQGNVEFEVLVADQSGQTAASSLSIDVDPAPELTILNQSSLPLGAVGVPYRADLKAAAGSEPYRWVKKKKAKFGELPAGVLLSKDGVLSGTPTLQGVYNFTVRVVDSLGKIASKALVIEIGPPPPPLEVRTALLPNAHVNTPYATALEAAGGVGPYHWAVESGTLPEGLILNTGGQISGSPVNLVSSSFVVKVRDSIGTTSTKSLFIIVTEPPPPLRIQTVSLPDGSAERFYSQDLLGTGGVPPYRWSLSSGILGAGLNLSADGRISGIPPVAETNVFVVKLTDSVGQTVTRTLAIIVKPADKLAPFGALETPGDGVTLANTVSGTGWALDNVGVALIEVLVDGQKITEAIYGLPRPDIAVAWGHLPNGGLSGFKFTFDTVLLQNGDHTLVVRAIDTSGNAATLGARRIHVQNRTLQILSAVVSRGKKLEPYSFQFVAADGVLPYIWTIVSGSLPQGLSLNASGLISGTPQVFGTFTFSVRVTDATGAFAIATFTMSISPDIEPLRIVSSGEQSPGQEGVEYFQQLFFVGGVSPRTWSVSSGSLPPGLTLDSTSGQITGTPTQSGSFTFRVNLRDGAGTTVTSDPLIITILPPDESG